MTMFVYVDTSKQVGDRDHLKVGTSHSFIAALFLSTRSIANRSQLMTSGDSARMKMAVR